MRPVHELFIGAGIVLFVLQFAVGVTQFALMSAGVVPFGGPSPILWVAMAAAVWLALIGCVVGFVRGWK